MANLFADIIKPTPTVIEPVKPKRNIFDDLFEATTATEGLISGQTPLRITNPQMRQWKTIQGVPRDPNAVIPEDRQNFFFVKPEQVPDVIKSQWKNYFKTPEKFNLTPDSSLEDAIKTFDQQNPQNKIKFLQDKGIDIKQKLKSFDINKLNPLRVGTAEAAETNLFADLAPKQTNLFADIAQPKPSFAEILGFPTERYPNGVPPELKPNWLSALEAPIKGLASGVTDIPRKLARPSYKTPKQVAEYEGREEEVARFRKKHPVLTGAGEIVGSTAPYIAATTAGLPLPSAFGAVGGISQVAGQLSTPEEKLSVGQRLGKVGTATVAGVITGTIFKAAGAGKNILSRILQRAGGAGATAITENIVQDAMSGKEPDPLKALAIGGRQAAIIGIIGAMVEVPTLRNAILREGRSLAKKPVNFQEAVEIIKKTGRNPESLSPEFQNAILEGQKKLAMDNIKASAKRYGVPVDVMKQVIQANNAQEALAITDRYLYKMSKVNPELASKLTLFRQQLSQGVHPADILIMQEVLDMAKPKATVEKVVEPPIIEPGLKVEPKIIQPKVEPSKFTGGKVTQPKVVKPTPVITQPLALEAKQYKTAEEVITDPARVQEIKNSIAEGEMILKSGKTIAGKKMSTGELEAVRKSVESAKAKITPPAKPPTAIAGEPEEENLKELEEFFASKAKEDVASKLSEEDIAKSQSEMKIITYESRESLFKAIKENGGIAPYAKGYLKENWKAAPLNLKNKNGLPPDEMADVLKNQGFHFEGDNDLLQAILQEQRLSKLEKIEYKEAKQSPN